jgi:glutamate N-acetyltransferase/amino-acid N-acetyltransferase
MASIMCNGMAGNKKITSPQSKDYKLFKEKLEEMCLHLAKLIVSDGEGATKLVEYKVINAPTERKARQIIRTVSDSALVKTALYGRDPNWGRILAAAGRSGVDFDPDIVDLHIGGASKAVQLVKAGQPTDQSLTQVKQMMRASHIHIILDLNQGDAEATGWGTDFSYEYVRINAEYTT